MPSQQYTPIDALDRAIRTGRLAPVSVPVECPCGNSLDGYMFVVRDFDDRWGDHVDTVIEDCRDGDGPTVMQCDICERQLAADVVVLRDRQRRCVERIAELHAVT